MSEPFTRADLESALTKFADQIGGRFESLETRFESLETKFESLETRTNERFESLATRMNERFESLETRMDDRFESLATRMNERFESLETRMNEQLERTETSLLTAFHSWTRTHEMREKGTSSTLASFGERLRETEDRLSEVERQLREQRPPAA